MPDNPMLLPCPWCGSNDVFVVEGIWQRWVECYGCGADGRHFASAETAVLEWNRMSELVDKGRKEIADA